MKAMKEVYASTRYNTVKKDMYLKVESASINCASLALVTFAPGVAHAL